MTEEKNYPTLRYIEAFPIEQNGQKYFYIRDPLEIASSPLIMSPIEFYIASLFNGAYSIADIKDEFSKKFTGISIPNERISQIVELLDSNYYLDTRLFHDHAESVMADFHQSPIRKAWHAGVSYEADPQKLKKQLDSFYTHPQGAGLPDSTNSPTNGFPSDSYLEAILAPHIDLRVGAPCYTHAYRYLIEHCDAELFVILGVAHYGGGRFFITTSKNFETPLGIVETDKKFLDMWHKNAGIDLSQEEWVHRIEHSIEFQLPFLQHGIKKPFKIVPVLCGAIESHLKEELTSDSIPEVSGLIKSLKQTIKEQKKRVAFILSVDLAHMGPKFGDTEKLSTNDFQRIKEADYNMFEIVSRFDMEAYQKLVRKDLVHRKVDACSAIYTLLSVMGEGKGKMLSYDQNYQEDTHSIVSYGTMIFWKE